MQKVHGKAALEEQLACGLLGLHRSVPPFPLIGTAQMFSVPVEQHHEETV